MSLDIELKDLPKRGETNGLIIKNGYIVGKWET